MAERIYMYGWCMELSTVLCAVMCRSAVYGVGDGFGGYMGCLRVGIGLEGARTTFAPF